MAVSEITPQALKTKLKAGEEPIEILDVREERKFQEKHIPESLSIPYKEGFVEGVKKRFKNELDISLVVYSEHEEMGVASRACKELDAAGFTKVHHLVGGIMAWMEAGGTIEFGRGS